MIAVTIARDGLLGSRVSDSAKTFSVIRFCTPEKPDRKPSVGSRQIGKRPRDVPAVVNRSSKMKKSTSSTRTPAIVGRGLSRPGRTQEPYVLRRSSQVDSSWLCKRWIKSPIVASAMRRPAIRSKTIPATPKGGTYRASTTSRVLSDSMRKRTVPARSGKPWRSARPGDCDFVVRTAGPPPDRGDGMRPR